MLPRAGAPALIVALMLGACAPQVERLGTGTPSLSTAQTALASGAPEFALKICSTLLEKGQRRPDVLVCRNRGRFPGEVVALRAVA